MNKVGYKRYISAKNRILPNFLILGAHKAGSSSLYLNLIKHPNILPAITKEIMYFDAYYGSTKWYKANFPLKKEYEKVLREKDICRVGEATPQYLFHPLVPERVKKTIPNTKFIVALRNPIDRAYSHYNHNIYKKIEPLDFQQALEKRKDKLERAKELTLKNDVNGIRYYENFSYLEKGEYASQLEKWFKLFSKNQFFIFKTEDLNQKTWKMIFNFLDLPDFDFKEEKFSVRTDYQTHKWEPMKESERKWLVEYYKTHNEKLAKLLDIELDWDR